MGPSFSAFVPWWLGTEESNKTCSSSLPCFSWRRRAPRPPGHEGTPDCERALANLNLHLGEALCLEGATAQKQKALSGLIDSEAASRLREAAAGTRDRARLNCVSRAGAGDWLSALPSKALGLHLRKCELILAARYRLGLPIFLQEGECPAQSLVAGALVTSLGTMLFLVQLVGSA